MPMSSPTPGASPRGSLSERAYLVIRERILKGELPLGAPLSRRKVAAELGMSLLPVSEAFQLLESDELVESRPRVGTRVCRPSTEQIRERYEIREALESQSARLYAQRASLRQKLEMEKMAEHMDAMFNRSFDGTHSDREFLYAVHSYHQQFHLKLADGASCRALRQTIEKNHVLLFNWLFDIAASRPPLPPRHHRNLIDVLNRGDADEADRAMRAHVRYGREIIVVALRSHAKAESFKRVK